MRYLQHPASRQNNGGSGSLDNADKGDETAAAVAAFISHPTPHPAQLLARESTGMETKNKNNEAQQQRQQKQQQQIQKGSSRSNVGSMRAHTHTHAQVAHSPAPDGCTARMSRAPAPTGRSWTSRARPKSCRSSKAFAPSSPVKPPTGKGADTPIHQYINTSIIKRRQSSIHGHTNDSIH